jgi:hypothetical protein
MSKLPISRLEDQSLDGFGRSANRRQNDPFLVLDHHSHEATGHATLVY